MRLALTMSYSGARMSIDLDTILELERLLAPQDAADHLDVFAGPGERLPERLAVPPLDDLRP